jgi:hypothetical protein
MLHRARLHPGRKKEHAEACIFSLPRHRHVLAGRCNTPAGGADLSLVAAGKRILAPKLGAERHSPSLAAMVSSPLRLPAHVAG